MKATRIPVRLREGHRAEEGMALVIAMTFAVLTVGLVYFGTVSLRSHEREVEVSTRVRGQASAFADSGIIDCIDWLRRQSTQPVKVFDPKLDALATPPMQDTDDPSIGIVRSYEIGKGIWGRYEVRKFVPNATGIVSEMRDISFDRGASGAGSVWRIVSRSYIFRNVNPDLPYNQLPNQVLATKVFETEARRLVFSPPAETGVACSSGQAFTTNHFGKITGGSAAGVAYPSGTGSPGGAGTITGSPAEAILTTWDDSPEGVFGVSEDVLRAMATTIITHTSQFPDRVSSNQFIFSEADLSFYAGRPLLGTGILYIKGKLTIGPNSQSNFNGIIYVQGKTVIDAPTTINGTIIALGDINVIGTGDWSDIIYDDSVINGLLTEFGQYRQSSAIYEHDLSGTIKTRR